MKLIDLTHPMEDGQDSFPGDPSLHISPHATIGKDPCYKVHHLLEQKPAEIVIVESLTILDQAPDTFTLITLPLNMKGADGSPIRAVAMM